MKQLCQFFSGAMLVALGLALAPQARGDSQPLGSIPVTLPNGQVQNMILEGAYEATFPGVVYSPTVYEPFSSSIYFLDGTPETASALCLAATHQPNKPDPSGLRKRAESQFVITYQKGRFVLKRSVGNAVTIGRQACVGKIPPKGILNPETSQPVPVRLPDGSLHQGRIETDNVNHDMASLNKISLLVEGISYPFVADMMTGQYLCHDVFGMPISQNGGRGSLVHFSEPVAMARSINGVFTIMTKPARPPEWMADDIYCIMGGTHGGG